LQAIGVAAAQRQDGAGPRQLYGDGAADSTAGTGYHGHLAMQVDDHVRCPI
jgi:hypothetical protein